MRKYTKTHITQGVKFDLQVEVVDESRIINVSIKTKDKKSGWSESIHCDFRFPWEDYYIAKEITKVLTSEEINDFFLSVSARKNKTASLETFMNKSGFVRKRNKKSRP